MQIDWSLFPVNKLDLKNPAILIRPEQADATKGKNVVIGDPRLKNYTGLTPSCKVVMEKLPDGSMMSSHERKAEGSTLARDDGKRKLTAADQEQVVRPPWWTPTGNTVSQLDCSQSWSDHPTSEQSSSDDQAAKSRS
jgi:hypothetical protein